MHILHHRLPDDQTQPRALPGIQPLDPRHWLIVDEVFAAQMALRDVLLAERRAEVLQMQEGARPAAEELLEAVLQALSDAPGYAVGAAPADEVLRPDGVRVAVDRGDPLCTVGRLVQEDMCLMQRQGDAHVLTGAVLCFPASWTLAEKLGRPLIGIHRTVEAYDEGLARRVQRLLDGVRPGRPLWRFNRLRYACPDLFQPRSESAPRQARGSGYLRSERQVLWRLPETDAVAFSIHTYLAKE